MLSLYRALSILGINGPLIEFRRKQVLRLSPEHKKIVLDYLREDLLKTNSSYELNFMFNACTQGYRMWDELEELLDSLTTLEVSQKLKNKVDIDD
ncbi:MAG: hypothetical protein J6A97_00745 [Clostridia bacterium]|nr:hypothetical protein [Clostridia bacterium]